MYKTILRTAGLKFSLLLFTLCFLGTKEASASHAAGADLTYQSIGNGQYIVTFTFYRDCGGITAPTSQSVTVSSFTCNFTQSFSLPVQGPGIEVTNPCSTASTTCGTGNGIGIQQYTYQATITLPATCIDWQFSASVSARNDAVTTIVDPDFENLYVEAYLNNIVSENNSPTFTNPPIAFVCVGQDNYLNHGIIDVDGDSIVYSFIAPRTDGNTPLVYQPGFSVANPFVSNPPVNIDPITGDIFIHPLQSDTTIIAVLIQEYRDGVIIGSVMRDMQIYAVHCSNTLPTLSGVSGTPIYEANACVGGPLCFDVYSNDADPGDSLTLTWNQGIPGATFTVVGNPPIGTFCWTPTPADARPQPYTFTVTVKDNACPSRGVQTYSYYIEVSNMDVQLTSTPSLQCYGAHNGSAAATSSGNPPVQYVWTFPNGTIVSGTSVSHLGGGNYTLNVSDNTGCVTAEYFTITEPPQLIVGVTPTNAGCGGSLGSALATVTGGTPSYAYLWTPGGQTTANATGLVTGLYTVKVTDDHSCTATGSTNVQSNTPVNFTLNVTGATCLANDGTASVTHTGGTGSYSYKWTPDIPGDTTSSNITGLITGSYTVIATDLGTGCSETLTAIVPNLSGLSATITASSDATCENGDDGSATVAASGGQTPYSYLWPNGDTTASTNNLSPGTHLARVEDYNGCLAYASVTIGFVNPAPFVDLGPDTMPCIGVPYMLDAGPGLIYLWSDNSTNQTLTVSSSNVYSVIVTNAFGCENSDAINVTFVTCAVSNPSSSNRSAVVNIYPNPIHNELNVNVSRIRDTDVTLTLTDILGNKLYFSKESANYGYSKKIDIHSLPAGIYLMKVEYDGEISTSRIIKQ